MQSLRQALKLLGIGTLFEPPYRELRHGRVQSLEGLDRELGVVPPQGLRRVKRRRNGVADAVVSFLVLRESAVVLAAFPYCSCLDACTRMKNRLLTVDRIQVL